MIKMNRQNAEHTLRLEGIEAEAWGNLYRAASLEDRTTCGLRSPVLGTTTCAIASNVDVLGFNRVIGLGVEKPASMSQIDEIVERYLGAGVNRFFIQLSPFGAPRALPDWLEHRGFRHYNNWMKLVRGVEPPPDVTTDLKVEEIGPERSESFAALVATCLDWPASVQPWIASIVGRPRWKHYLALDEGTPVATGALYASDGWGWIDFASTSPTHRRRGAQGALMARRIRDAADLGLSRLVVETAEERPGHPSPSFRNAQRLGFEVAYIRPNYIYEVESR